MQSVLLYLHSLQHLSMRHPASQGMLTLVGTKDYTCTISVFTGIGALLSDIVSPMQT